MPRLRERTWIEVNLNRRNILLIVWLCSIFFTGEFWLIYVIVSLIVMVRRVYVIDIFSIYFLSLYLTQHTHTHLFQIFINLGTRDPSKLSAYSVFNSNYRTLPGQFRAAHIESALRSQRVEEQPPTRRPIARRKKKIIDFNDI